MGQKKKKKERQLLSSIRDPYNIILIAIFIFSLIIRFRYAFLPTVWVDEGRYSLIGRALLHHPLSYKTNVHGVVKSYPPLYPTLLFLAQLVLGEGDFATRVVNPILGAFLVLAVYYFGKELFNRRVGLIAAALMAVAPYSMFFSDRRLLEIPHVLFFTLGIAFFYSGWEKKKPRNLYLSAIFLALGVLVKQPGYIALAVIGLWLLIFYRTSWIKDRKIWKAVLIFALVLAPWSIRSLKVCGKLSCEASYAVFWFEHKGGGLDVVQDPLYYIKLLPWILNKWVFVFSFFIGAVLLVSDKNKRKEFALLALWFIAILFVFSITPVKVPRYVISIIVPGILLTAYGIERVTFTIFKDRTTQGVICVLLTGFLMYSSYSQGVLMIKAHANDFSKLIDAGKYFENIPPNEVVVTATPEIIGFYGNDQKAIYYPRDKEKFAEYLYKKNVSYVVLDVYERTQPSWTWSFVPKQPYLKPVKTYYQRGKIAVIIYKVNRTALRQYLGVH